MPEAEECDAPWEGNHTELVTQPINAVYYRQATLSQRTRLFMDFLAERLPAQYAHGP